MGDERSTDERNSVLLRLRKRTARALPSVEDWEKRRSRHYSSTVVVEPAVDLLADILWLSMVCFVENIDPGTLGLSDELHERLLANLKTLERYDTLEVYWRCLESLRSLGEISERGEADASDTE